MVCVRKAMQIFLRPRPVCLLLVVIYLASQANLITLLQNSSDKTGSDINPENLQGILIPSGKFFTPPDSSKKSKKRPIAHATALRHTAIAGKEDKNLTTPSYMHVERTDKSIVFVHIGKAGGETIKAALEVGCAVKKNKLARKQCKTSLQHSALSDQVKGYFHCFRVLPKENVINQTTTTSYLYNIRHPVHRIVSWYRYIHPSHCNAENKGISQNCQAALEYREDANGFAGQFFYTCFPSLELFAYSSGENMKLRRDDANQIVPSLTKECKALGQQVLLGQLDRHTIHLGVHMIANYKHYLNRTTLMHPDKEILVIRTESLWADMKHLDLWLGGNGTFGNLEGLKISHGSETYAKRDELSETGTKLLCCFLLDEMILYRHLLESAANLDEGTKSDAIISAAKQCYFPTWDVMVSKCQAP